MALISSGVLLLCGLLTGLWKYAAINASAEAVAPVYVDICHRASLMYSFAALLLATLAAHSAWPDWLDLLGVAVPLVFFFAAIASYAIHGYLRDTENQLQRPHRLGQREVSPGLMRLFMGALAAGEIGGVLILLSGLLRNL